MPRFSAIESTRNALIDNLTRGFGSLVNVIEETKALPKNGE